MLVPQYVDTGGDEMDVSGLFSVGSVAPEDDTIDFGESWTTVGTDAGVCQMRRRATDGGSLLRSMLAPVVPARKRSISSCEESKPGQTTAWKKALGDTRKGRAMPTVHRVLSTVSEKSNEDSIPTIPRRRDSNHTNNTGRRSKSSKASLAQAA